MTGPDKGFLLLTSHLGDPSRRPLTVAQFRELSRNAGWMGKPPRDGELTQKDLMEIGCDGMFARRVLTLLSQEEQLDWYVRRGQRMGCVPITRINEHYPQRVRACLGLEAPGCLWAKGSLALLERPMIALVGSRDLRPENEAFARRVGQEAARQGYVLVSGNARGADKVGQNSCLASGGAVISVVADELTRQPWNENVLYLSEDGYDLAHSTPRALSRNRIIHTLGQKVFVAQCRAGGGGTWSGSTKNLRFGWSRVYCFQDGTQGCAQLLCRGASAVSISDVENISAL